jgi:uncharacterized RDD family membrane protein YckC
VVIEMLAKPNMKCQNCETPVAATDEVCGKCGAKLLHRRVIMGVPKPENFSLTAEETPPDTDAGAEFDDWQFPTRAEMAQLDHRPVAPVASPLQVRWGGFFRRANALGIDLFVISLLSTIMAAMAYVGYKVGLGAHGLVIAADNAGALFAILTLGWVGLTSGYFIVLHGQGGQTIGKRLLGLRVVGADRQPPSFRQAAIRWFAAVGFAPIGLGFLWVLWQAEKRGWHDFAARTWVIHE